LEAPMLTVEVDAAAVEARLLAGQIVCPDCSGILSPWGFGRPRWLREVVGRVRVRPRRAICAGCGRTHVLLPVIMLVRRADLVEVIGTALLARAAGMGQRSIAGLVGRARSTVRGWLVRFASRAAALRQAFTAVLVAVEPDPVPPAATGSLFADAVAAIFEAGAAVVRRWAPAVFTVSPWRVMVAVTGGRVLSPDLRVMSINTSRSWPGPL
jgi:transposase-like protein